MRATVVEIVPGRPVTERVITEKLTLSDLRKFVGGDVEAVPFFRSIALGLEVVKCVAFCDEDGKMKNLEMNTLATNLWREAAMRLPGVKRQFRQEDFLVGPVIVVAGDDDFMATL
jgi:Domain of unknown function (DUF3846)